MTTKGMVSERPSIFALKGWVIPVRHLAANSTLFLGKTHVKVTFSNLFNLFTYKLFILEEKNTLTCVFPEKKSNEPIRTIRLNSLEFSIGQGVVGIIGAGNFTSAMILPCL
jgi:hypothetical protein